MNALQTMLAAGNAQAIGVNTEPVVINGSTLQGTFGDPEMMPLMSRTGYEDHLVIPLKVSAVQFASDPPAKVTITRPGPPKREYFVQMVDHTNPVVYTFILTDREV
jgi:hypothetical protein